MGIGLCTLLPTLTAQGNTLHYQLDGAAVGDQFGYAVARLADIDGDGFGDFVVTAPYADPGGLVDAGSAFVYSGAAGTLLHTYHGATAGDRLGMSLANIGDADGDGFDDFTIGAPFADINGLVDNGGTYTYSGATGLLIRQFRGFFNDGQHGRSVSWVGDMDQDGKMDFLASEPNANPQSNGLSLGNVKIYSPARGTAFFTMTTSYHFGDQVASAGDINGDGVNEIFARNAYYGFGSPRNLRIFRGDDGSTLIGVSDSGEAMDQARLSFARLGDLNQDGFPDFAVGSEAAGSLGTNRGVANFYSGLTMNPIRHFSGPNDYDYYGTSVAGNADLNADGVLDFGLAVGGTFLGATNRIQVHSGVNSNLLFEIHGSDGFGSALDFLADVDGDGLGDVAVGSPLASPGGLSSAGTLSVYR
ncbi:MAG: integrin alpha [Planctomycetota bacterium]